MKFDIDEGQLHDALVSLIESVSQAPGDFCGEQREFHLPRLSKAQANLMMIFPREFLKALEVARDPDGKLLVSDD